MSGVNSNWASPAARRPLGSYGTYGSAYEKKPSWFFPLMRSWATGFVVFTVVSWLLGAAVSGVFDARLHSFGWRFALVYVPNAVSVALAVLLAGRVHRAPHRDSLPRHAAATVTVPLFAFALTVVNGWGVLNLEVIAMAGAAVLVGAACGLGIDRVLEERRR